MVYRTMLVLFLLVVFTTGCNNHQREDQFAQREAALLEREKAFTVKETEYKVLLRMRDSLLTIKDTTVAVQIWPEDIAGEWNSRMVCRESNCKDYVVGDQRTDSWEFLADSTGIYTKVINKNKLIRVFHGKISNDQIILHYRTDSTATRMVDMQVSLTKADSTLMKGTQIIRGENDCSARFSVELSRVVKN